MPLTADDCRVDADIRRAETLPAAAFVEPEFLARELDTVFRTSWHLVPARSGFAPRGRFASHDEQGPHWFHRKVARAVFGGR